MSCLVRINELIFLRLDSIVFFHILHPNTVMSKVLVLMAFVEFVGPVFQPRSILVSSGCPRSSDLVGSLEDSHSWNVMLM